MLVNRFSAFRGEELVAAEHYATDEVLTQAIISTIHVMLMGPFLIRF
jgi:hypothetical protein